MKNILLKEVAGQRRRSRSVCQARPGQPTARSYPGIQEIAAVEFQDVVGRVPALRSEVNDVEEIEPGMTVAETGHDDNQIDARASKNCFKGKPLP